GRTAVAATGRAGLRLGHTAVVDGIGGVGVLVVQAARQAGARVIAIADSEEKRQLALSCGASDAVLAARDEDFAGLPSAVRDLTGGRGGGGFFGLIGATEAMTAGGRGPGQGGPLVAPPRHHPPPAGPPPEVPPRATAPGV